MEVYGWLILRVTYAWMFLYPLKGLLIDWSSTKNLTQLVIPCQKLASLLAVLMCLTMLLGALSILLGFYGQIAGLALSIYCLMGAVVHYRLATQAEKISLSSEASLADQQSLKQCIQLSVVGNTTSAQKNLVLAAVGCFFMLMGTGPCSLAFFS